MIPKLIHWIWLGRKKLPTEFLPKWQAEFNDWLQVIWDEEKIRTYLGETITKDMAEQALTYAEMSDILRLEILRQYGGVYLDCDVELVKGEPDIFDALQDIECGFVHHRKQLLSNWIIVSVPRHAFIIRLLEQIKSGQRHINRYDSAFTGPRLVTKHWDEQQWGTTLLPRKLFQNRKRTPDCLAIHHNRYYWRQRTVDKNAALDLVRWWQTTSKLPRVDEELARKERLELETVDRRRF